MITRRRGFKMRGQQNKEEFQDDDVDGLVELKDDKKVHNKEFQVEEVQEDDEELRDEEEVHEDGEELL